MHKIAYGIIGLIIIGLGLYLWSSRDSNKETDLNGNELMMADGSDQRTLPVQPTSTPVQTAEENVTATKFSGQILAGSSSPLIDFNRSDYEAALSSGKTVFLYFYANWCPICRVEFPIAQSAFNELSDDSIVGFRVNFNDNETDDFEEQLARDFGVAYQHTKVVLEGGQRTLKSPETWNLDRYRSELGKY